MSAPAPDRFPTTTPSASSPVSTRPVLVEFRAPWCPHCSQMASVMAELTREFDGRVDVVSVDTTTPSGRSLASESGVTTVPTFLLLRRGRETARVVGAVPKGRLHRALEDAVTHDADGVAH